MTQVYRGVGKYIQLTCGTSSYGHCVLEVVPKDAGSGFTFEDRTDGGTIPRKFMPATKRGVREAMARGTLAGYPVVDVGVSVVDGSYHEIDSHALAFQLAGYLAFLDAYRQVP